MRLGSGIAPIRELIDAGAPVGLGVDGSASNDSSTGDGEAFLRASNYYRTAEYATPPSHPRFHELLTAFKNKTGCPVLVNTSFNVRGEPIVCTPEDAFRCFMGTDVEALAMENCYLRKEDQDPALKQNYSHAFELD